MSRLFDFETILLPYIDEFLLVLHNVSAFNEPGSSLVSRTRVKTLAQDTLEGKQTENFISKLEKS